jgi:regulator of protease activity HflC (stomatin/prohibitin superfamily)
MNRVLAAERNSQAQLIEARTRAEVEQIQAQAHAEAKRTEAEADAEAIRLRAEMELRLLEERRKAGAIYGEHPALLRLEELQSIRDLARNANARIYLNFDKTDDDRDGDAR